MGDRLDFYIINPNNKNADGQAADFKSYVK